MAAYLLYFIQQVAGQYDGLSGTGQLQDQLSSIEGELQSARRYYNATVRDLNSTIQSFPPVLIARPMGFTEGPFYQDDDPAIQSAPKVAFPKPAA